MQPIHIRVNRVGDPPAFPEHELPIEELRFDTVTILEHGTMGKKTSLLYTFLDKDGKRYYAELTKGLVDMIHGAATGADLRFQEEPNPNLG